MSKFSAKNKIIVLLVAWLLVSGLMLLYFFSILDGSNQHTIDSMAQQKKDLAVLQAEQDSYKKAKGDLAELSTKTLQPSDFFNQDITLVKEIQILEGWGQKFNINMQLSGISGTVTNAPKAKTATPIVVIPYAISLSGSFNQIIDFVEVLEHLSFVTNVTAVSLNAGDKGQINASLTANFFLKK